MTEVSVPNMRLAVSGSGGPGYAKGKSYVVVGVNVGQEGLAHIRSGMLNNGPLSRRVAELFGMRGVAFAPMLEGVTPVVAGDFQRDSVGLDVAHKWLAEFAFVRWGADCLLVFEEPWQKMSDVARRRNGVRFFGCESFPYYVSEPGNLYRPMEDLVGYTGFLRFGFIIQPSVPLPPTGAEADARTIEALAQNTKMAFMSAYDNTGYVAWTKG
jgi:hypothetical protein